MKTIILEGPDGAGKSTLARAFKQLDYAVVPFGVPPLEFQKDEESIFRFFFNELYKQTTEGPDNVVFDRLHLSDRAYAFHMRDGTPMTERNELIIERYIEAIDGQIVICLPPRRTCFQNWLAKGKVGDEYVKDANIWNYVYEHYSDLLFNIKRNQSFMWYDYTRRNAYSFALALKHAQGHPLGPGMVGSQRPRFLFVGERANGLPDLPFMTPTNSSGWLFDVLDDAGFKEQDMAFINTFKTDGSSWYSHEFMEGFNFDNTTVITLGKIAHEAWGELPHEQLEHPQYMKRFKNGERHEYVKRLEHIRRNSP
jgi:hypothetical protein